MNPQRIVPRKLYRIKKVADFDSRVTYPELYETVFRLPTTCNDPLTSRGGRYSAGEVEVIFTTLYQGVDLWSKEEGSLLWTTLIEVSPITDFQIARLAAVCHREGKKYYRSKEF